MATEFALKTSQSRRNEEVANPIEMLEEQGVVTDVRGHECWIDVCVRSACEQCTKSCVAVSFGRNRSSLRLKLEKPPDLDLVPGDRVTLGISEDRLVAAAARVYLAPLLSLLGGAVFGSWLATQLAWTSVDIAAILGALFGLILYFLYSKFAGAVTGSALEPVILRRC